MELSNITVGRPAPLTRGSEGGGTPGGLTRVTIHTVTPARESGGHWGGGSEGRLLQDTEVKWLTLPGKLQAMVCWGEWEERLNHRRGWGGDAGHAGCHGPCCQDQGGEEGSREACRGVSADSQARESAASA